MNASVTLFFTLGIFNTHAQNDCALALLGSGDSCMTLHLSSASTTPSQISVILTYTQPSLVNMKIYLNIVAFLSLESIARCQVHFDCPQLPPLTQPAKTVHELRPQDIKVIMALGDSVTAGTAE